jgi:hypothetical protein
MTCVRVFVQSDRDPAGKLTKEHVCAVPAEVISTSLKLRPILINHGFSMEMSGFFWQTWVEMTSMTHGVA